MDIKNLYKTGIIVVLIGLIFGCESTNRCDSGVSGGSRSTTLLNSRGGFSEKKYSLLIDGKKYEWNVNQIYDAIKNKLIDVRIFIDNDNRNYHLWLYLEAEEKRFILTSSSIFFRERYSLSAFDDLATDNKYGIDKWRITFYK